MTMLEKMAWALSRLSTHGEMPNGETVSPEDSQYFVVQARAALLAIREPDEAVIAAGVAGIDEVEGDCATEDGTAAGFTSMINAILAGTAPEAKVA